MGITDSKNAEETREEMVEVLEESNLDLEQFLFVAAQVPRFN